MNNILSQDNKFLVLANARASFYAFLKIHFTNLPDKPFVLNVRRDEFRGVLDGLKQDRQVHREIANGAGLMQAYLRATKGLEVRELAERLGIDRTRLYRGVSPNYGPPPPYEALWVDDPSNSSDLFQQISHIYAEGGFGLIDDTQERLDYIGLELDYLEQLVKKEVLAREADDADAARSAIGLQGIFLREHLGKWAPKFVTKALEYAHTDFYRGHLHMLNGFIEQEKEVVRQIVEKYSGQESS